MPESAASGQVEGEVDEAGMGFFLSKRGSSVR